MNELNPKTDGWRETFAWATAYTHNDLFRPGPYTALNACVGANGGPHELSDYATGYFAAGRRLAESLLANRIGVDTVVYPLVFVYRHAIELSLKHLVAALPQIWGDKRVPELTHKLADNWLTAKQYLARDDAFQATTLVPQLDAVLTDFLELDPTGEAFRFPTARKGSPFLQGTTHINIVVLAQAMLFVEEAFSLFRDVAEALLQRRSAK